jgi:hypothetical protein
LHRAPERKLAKYLLALLRDSGWARKEAVDLLLREATELADMLASEVMKLKNKSFKI